jgi:hypothetical protein
VLRCACSNPTKPAASCPKACASTDWCSIISMYNYTISYYPCSSLQCAALCLQRPHQACCQLPQGVHHGGMHE